MDIFHIAALENPFNHEVGFGIIINLLKVYVPKNAFVEYGLCFFIHNAKVIKEDMIAAKGQVINENSFAENLPLYFVFKLLSLSLYDNYHGIM